MKMLTTRIAALPLPQGVTKVKIVEKIWGIERCYTSPDGEQVCTPAPFHTNYRNLDWPYCI